jgi:hypothetical protein
VLTAVTAANTAIHGLRTPQPQHVQDKPLPLDISVLARRAEEAHALAKLLHYTEQEYLRDTEGAGDTAAASANASATAPSLGGGTASTAPGGLGGSTGGGVRRRPRNESVASAVEFEEDADGGGRVGKACRPPRAETLEALISVNHRLGLKQAAAGVLRHAQVSAAGTQGRRPAYVSQ